MPTLPCGKLKFSLTFLSLWHVYQLLSEPWDLRSPFPGSSLLSWHRLFHLQLWCLLLGHSARLGQAISQPNIFPIYEFHISTSLVTTGILCRHRPPRPLLLFPLLPSSSSFSVGTQTQSLARPRELLLLDFLPSPHPPFLIFHHSSLLLPKPEGTIILCTFYNLNQKYILKLRLQKLKKTLLDSESRILLKEEISVSLYDLLDSTLYRILK